MKQTLRVQFDEQSKAVTASVDLTVHDNSMTNDEVLAEAKRLFDEASKYSATKTLIKNR